MRRIQKWSLLSIFEEYRRFAGVKLQLQQPIEQFIEIFDIDSFSNVIIKNTHKHNVIDDKHNEHHSSVDENKEVEHELMLTPTKYSSTIIRYYSNSPPPVPNHNHNHTHTHTHNRQDMNDKMIQIPEFVKNCYMQQNDMK